MIRPGGILYLLSLFLALWPAAGIAQTGSVRGSVVDQTGLVLPGATVILGVVAWCGQAGRSRGIEE